MRRDSSPERDQPAHVEIAAGAESDGEHSGVGPSVYTDVCKEQGSWVMWAALLAAVSGPVLWGWTLGFTSPTFSVSTDAAYIQPYDLNYVFAITDEQRSWLTSITMVAAGVGALLGGIPVDRYGKKPVLIASNLLMAVGYVLFRFAPPVGGRWAWGADPAGSARGHWEPDDNTGSVAQLIVARAVMGLAGGLICMSTPAYTTEIVPLEQRGLFGCVYQFGLCIGLSAVYGLGEYIHWNTLCEVAVCVAGCGAAAACFVPESPQWLVNKGRAAAAEASLRRLRSGDTDVSTLLVNYTAAKPPQEGETMQHAWSELLQYPRNKALALAVGLIALQQLCGINVVTCYGGEIVGQVYPDPKVANRYATYMQYSTTCVVFAQAMIMPKFGRKTFLLVALVGIVLSYALMIAYLLDGAGALPKWVMLAGYYAYPATFSIGMGAIPWLMMGELFHPSVRGSACAICTAVSWTSAFLVMKTVDNLRAAFGGGNRGLGYVFCIYAGISVLGLFLIVRLPETRDRSYNAIERKLKGERKAAPPRETTCLLPPGGDAASLPDSP